MTEQWEELKETIIELRDNDGTGTQQEACEFLAKLMDVLEKQMQEPKTEYWKKKEVKEEKSGVIIISYKTVCSNCDCANTSIYKNYCPNCGARMESDR